MRRLLMLPATAGMLLLAACSGYTTGATNVTSTSATMNAHVDAGEAPAASYVFRYRQASPTVGPMVEVPKRNHNGYPEASWPLTGLQPDTLYQYQICGRPDESQPDTCVGDDENGDGMGEEGKVESFRTLPASEPPPPSSTIWLSDSEIAALPTTGTAASQVSSAANGWSGAAPNLSDQNDQNDTAMLAAALWGKRTSNQTLTNRVLSACQAMRGSEDTSGVRALALGRQLQSPIIACQIAGVAGTSDATAFRTWVGTLLDSPTTSGPTSTRDCSNRRPNNWGTHCTAARVIIDRYLGDTTDLATAANRFRGWAGDRAAYAGFSYGFLGWQADPSAPVGINPPGSTIQGHNVAGLQPEEMRRHAGGEDGPYVYPHPKNGPYPWEALQGAVVAAVVLERAGVSVKTAATSGLRRAYQKLADPTDWVGGTPWTVTGDDTWQPWLEACLYGSASFTPPSSTSPGKNLGFTNWSHANPTGKCG